MSTELLGHLAGINKFLAEQAQKEVDTLNAWHTSVCEQINVLSDMEIAIAKRIVELETTYKDVLTPAPVVETPAVEEVVEEKSDLAAGVPFPKPYTPPKISKKNGRGQKVPTSMEEIRDFFKNNPDGEFTTNELRDRFGYASTWGIIQRLDKLVAQGTVVYRVESLGKVNNKRYYRWAGKPDPVVRNRETVPEPPVPRPPLQTGGIVNERIRHNNSDIAAFLNQVKNQITVDNTGKNHIVITCIKTGERVSISRTPSDTNAVHKIRRDLARIGVRF